MHVKSVEDLDNCLQEIESLVAAFENCPNDLSDLQMMRKAVRIYQEGRRQLADDRLTWPEFEALAERLKAETAEVIKEDDVPWSPADAIDGFVDSISKGRKQASTEWIDRIESEVVGIESMSAIEANRLDTRISAPPAVLTESHQKRVASAAKLVQRRLDSLKIDWLVEKFKELSTELRRKFLKLVDNSEGLD
jgi:aryl carrier-like protein